MKSVRLLIVFFTCFVLSCSESCLHITAQAGALTQPASKKRPDQTYAVEVRDDFLQAVRKAGLSCPTKMPEVELTNRPSFGQYDEAANIVRTSKWEPLSSSEKAFFQDVSDGDPSEQATRQAFDIFVHRWTLVHEMAHWWQTCGHGRSKPTLYQIETDANRITLAYWRQADPTVWAKMAEFFRRVLDRLPSPVPADQAVSSYFNKNDERLALSSGLGYQWFQATIFTQLNAEQPQPSFAEALLHPL